jgi:maleate isomerase
MLEKVMQSLDSAASKRANYGTRARLGMMLPSENTIAEPQISAMLPPGISLHTTRLQLNGSTRNLVSMIDRLEEATALLADAQVTRIAFHCTGVSMWSPDIVEEISRRVATVTDIPLVITSEAVVDALRVLEARKIVLLTPYVQDTNDREVRFLSHRGITVLRERGLGISSGLEMAAVEPQQWYREAIAMRDPAADAYFISCTTVRSTDVIEELERELGRPVVTSNQAMVWSALRSCKINDAMSGYGRLLREF